MQEPSMLQNFGEYQVSEHLFGMLRSVQVAWLQTSSNMTQLDLQK